jgi:hypothetical protein
MAITNASTTLRLTHRLRRLRQSEPLRAMIRETRLAPEMFILPLFVCEGEGVRREVPSMPGVFNLSVDEAVKEAAAAKADGVSSVILFGLPDRRPTIPRRPCYRRFELSSVTCRASSSPPTSVCANTPTTATAAS